MTGPGDGVLTANRYFSLLPAALLLHACAATATRETVCDGRQLMIGFVPGVDVTRTGFDAGLSRDAGVPVNYMRYMFDDYYLYCAGLEGRETALDDVLERLQDRPDIRTVEIDRIKRPQRID